MIQMRFLLFVIITSTLVPVSYTQTEPILRIGLVADPQYADKPPSGKRYYRESPWKLKEAIGTFNLDSVDFVQNLGDIIDVGWESYDSILPVYQQLDPGIENHHLLGNHDFSVPPDCMTKLLGKLSMPDRYYSYERPGWLFIILDANDFAYHSNPLHNRDVRTINKYYDSTIGKENHYTWNGAIGRKQQKWLKKELKRAEASNQHVIIFSHNPLRPLYAEENLWNNEEIIDIIESHSNVAAFINGHNHAGNYEAWNGIHYITVCGMVDTMVSSYCILEIYRNKMILKGFGNQRTIRMTLHP